MQVIVDSLLANYHKNGNGQQVVLLHGWGDNFTSFHNLSEYLSRKFCVITLDLPGFGGTSAPQTVWGLEEYASFVKNFLDKIEARNTYAFIGHSNGGAILIKGIVNKILKADKIILLASAGVRAEDQTRKKTLQFMAKGAKVLIAPLPKKVQTKFRKKGYSLIGSDMFVAEHMQDTFKRVVSEDILEDASKIKNPTLLIYGSKDTATPVRYGHKLHDVIDGSKLEIIDGAGHFVHHDEQQKVQQLIEDFLA